MRDLAFENGDIVIRSTDGLDPDLVVVDGGQSLAQRIWIALSVLTGEWYLDIREGVPYLSLMFTKNPNLTLIDSAIRDRILSVPEVARISQYSSDYDAARRTLNVTFRVMMDTGQLVDESIAISGV